MKNRGFTLIELLIAMAVLAIVVMQAVPAMQTAVTNSRLMSSAQSLRTFAQAARNEAIKRNETVRLEVTGSEVRIVRAAGTDDAQVLQSGNLSAGAFASSFTFDYASNGLALPFGSERTVTVGVASGCGVDDLRCPSVVLMASGQVNLCPTGVCK